MWLLCLGYAHDTSIVCGTSSGGASNLFFFSVEAPVGTHGAYACVSLMAHGWQDGTKAVI